MVRPCSVTSGGAMESCWACMVLQMMPLLHSIVGSQFTGCKHAPPSKQCVFPAWKNASTNSMQFHAYAAGTYTLLNPRINRSTRATPDHGCGVSTWSEEHWRRLEVSEPLKHELDRLSPSYTCLNNPELPVFLCWCSDLSISRHYFPHLHGCGQRCYKFTRLELVSECQLPECLLYIAMSSS